jgi:hypothetical protein
VGGTNRLKERRWGIDIIYDALGCVVFCWRRMKYIRRSSLGLVLCSYQVVSWLHSIFSEDNYSLARATHICRFKKEKIALCTKQTFCTVWQPNISWIYYWLYHMTKFVGEVENRTKYHVLILALRTDITVKR